MKKTIVFKTLVDILLAISFVSIIGIMYIVPFGVVTINDKVVALEDWNWYYWIIALIHSSTNLLILVGVYHLRVVARFLLSEKFFSEKTINSLKKSGNYFLLSGTISLTLISIKWLSYLFGGRFELAYNPNTFSPLILTIIGLFFIIQSNTLVLAKTMKEENELTV